MEKPIISPDFTTKRTSRRSEENSMNKINWDDLLNSYDVGIMCIVFVNKLRSITERCVPTVRKRLISVTDPAGRQMKFNLSSVQREESIDHTSDPNQMVILNATSI